MGAKLKEDGVLGTVAARGAASVLVLDGAAGWEKVNCRVLVELVLVVRGSFWPRLMLGAEMVGAAAGCEKLKPKESLLVRRAKPELVDPLLSILFDPDRETLPKGCSDTEVG